MKFSYAHFPVGTVFEIYNVLSWVKEKVFTVKEVVEPNPGNIVIVTTALQTFNDSMGTVKNYAFDITYVKRIIKRGDGPLKFNEKSTKITYDSKYQTIQRLIYLHTPKDGFVDHDLIFKAMIKNRLVDECYCPMVKMKRIKKFIKQRINSFLVKRKKVVAEYERILEEEYRSSIDYYSDIHSFDEEKEIVTEQALYEGSTMGSVGYERLKKNYKGVLSVQEVQQRLDSGRTSVDCVSSLEDNIVFFTDIYGFGYKVTPKHWVSSSTQIPMNVAPREGLEDGVVSNVQKFLQVFHDDNHVIETMDELLAYLNASKEDSASEYSYYDFDDEL